MCSFCQVACIDEEKPLKRLAFVRAQGSFWLTWVRIHCDVAALASHKLASTSACTRGSTDQELLGSRSLSTVLSPTCHSQHLIDRCSPCSGCVGLYLQTCVSQTTRVFAAQFSAAYSTGKTLVPLPHSVINALENTMSDLGGSLVSTAAQQSEKVRQPFTAAASQWLCVLALRLLAAG